MSVSNCESFTKENSENPCNELVIPEVFLDKLLYSVEGIRWGDAGHGELMLQGTGLRLVKGSLTYQYRLTMLDGLHQSN